MASIDERRKEAGSHLLKFRLLIEVKVVDEPGGIARAKVAKDVVKLVASRRAARECVVDEALPEPVLVIIVRGVDGKAGFPPNSAKLVRRLLAKVKDKFHSMDYDEFPAIFVVAHDRQERVWPESA